MCRLLEGGMSLRQTTIAKEHKIRGYCRENAAVVTRVLTIIFYQRSAETVS